MVGTLVVGRPTLLFLMAQFGKSRLPISNRLVHLGGTVGETLAKSPLHVPICLPRHPLTVVWLVNIPSLRLVTPVRLHLRGSPAQTP